MSEEPTGFENVAAAALAANPATPTEVAAAEKVWHDGMTPEQRRAAEIVEGQRLAAERAAGHISDPSAAEAEAAAQAVAAATAEPVDQLAQAGQESEAARMNRELFERIRAARNQPVPPPPPPQPTPPAILAQTAREMAEGARVSNLHAQQQATAVRVRPTANEVAAQGSTTPVFRPGDFIKPPTAPAATGVA